HKPGVGVFAISLFCSKGCKIDNITIRNNSFKYIGADGIQMGVSGRAISNVRVQGNYFEGNDAVGENGVDIKGVVGPIIVSGNTFKGFRPCESPKRGGQQDCTGSNGPGMVIHTGTSGMPYNVTVTDNDFINNVLGLVVSAGAHNIIVRGNRFTSNADTGLLVAGAYSIQADTNTFTNNPTQLRFQNTPQLGGYCTAIGNIFAGIGEKLVLVNSQCQQ
ncbi:MAG TPA: right-handed parallel beta-helix repeat-containing protein, partial [Anaerolineae bacterium]|nr:right-handed parallel beta-helix repeat-containing protein [Anaerolineae bacterium]